jgi:site-specific DNA-methyltransferase (adenine-specific)
LSGNAGPQKAVAEKIANKQGKGLNGHWIALRAKIRLRAIQSMNANRLYYGDCLGVINSLPDECCDLIYLDPPFNSNATYNVLFASPKGESSKAQIEAFDDTWHWGEQSESEFREILRTGSTDLSNTLSAIVEFLGRNDITAYLSMMASRLSGLHRVLKKSGSLYLHCDPTASHYLKVLLDAVFGPTNYLNEIIWQRTGAHNDAKRFGKITDTIFLYSKSTDYTFNTQYTPYSTEYVAKRFTYSDPDGRLFWPNTATSPSPRPTMTYQWKNCPTPANGWRFERKTMERLEAENRLYYSRTGMVYVKNYLDEAKGRPVQNLWTDIAMSKSGAERLGYPTQKPVALLERIISTSSNEGDLVLDPFCGCGTTIHAAEKLNRQWIGIDITHLAISLIERRLKDAFPLCTFETLGTPKDLESAIDLAERDKYQFQWWALSLINAQPFKGNKKGADGGIDGQIYFEDGGARKILVSVKGGQKVSVAMIRDLVGTVENNRAAIGIFITLAKPTRPMITEALNSGLYQSNLFPSKEFRRIQILTIEGLMSGAERPIFPDISCGEYNFRKAAKEVGGAEQKILEI